MQRHPVRRDSRTAPTDPTVHSAGRSNDPTVVHEVSGEIRWVDTDLQRIVVHVTDAGSHAGASLGQDLTFALDDAKIATQDIDGDGDRNVADLLPGVHVRVRTRIARSRTSQVPDLLEATSVATLPGSS
ncbi:hypothetical protein [Paraconexibacter sp.]|uniref:hypothetical protein n=1 Tax=Paraconexibacter sp. TaxID=2949640 RepID=UPI0035652F31